MKKAVASAITSIGLILALAPNVAADTTADEAAIRDVIENLWKNLAERKVDGRHVHPDGVIQATSAGGFWRTLSRDEVVSQIETGPTTLRAEPHYVRVKFLGAQKDVAFVSFYLSGSIDLGEQGVIDNYRTRASIVMEKVGGRWVESAAHYSALFGGSGVLPD